MKNGLLLPEAEVNQLSKYFPSAQITLMSSVATVRGYFQIAQRTPKLLTGQLSFVNRLDILFLEFEMTGQKRNIAMSTK